VPVRAVFFDVGDTLVEHWAPRERLNELLRAALKPDFGQCAWIEDFIAGKIGPAQFTADQTAQAPSPDDDALCQETLRWYREWFANAKIGSQDIDMDRLRVAMSVPLDLVSTPVPGAFDALRWCKQNGMRVVLVTNTLSRGDDEVWTDWRRFGLADVIDAVVSSHSAGWLKPHRRIFERAIELGGVPASEVVMVGDRLDADVFGAQRAGLRAVLRRTAYPQPPIDARPDATIDDLTELPSVLRAWNSVPTAHASLREGDPGAP
jgi:FMN phosphatase YigB (HAD superfamily)